jgi:hypothetical protein
MSEIDSESVSSFGDISVCDEIGQLIERCEELHEHIHNSFETLQTIQKLVQNQEIISVSYDGWTGDFGELLELTHLEALKEITEKGISNFGERLLDILDKINKN